LEHEAGGKLTLRVKREVGGEAKEADLIQTNAISSQTVTACFTPVPPRVTDFVFFLVSVF
jgi:hypothetical protein